jgi:hypothetical protein
MFGCAIASSGCGSSGSSMMTSAPSTKGLVGSYMVMITNDSHTDSDVMTVTAGTDDDLLLTFTAGITTDVAGPNPDGLRTSLKAATDVKGETDATIAAQQAFVDHSTGSLEGSISGTGTFKTDGIDFKMTFLPMGGSSMAFEITGSHL